MCIRDRVSTQSTWDNQKKNQKQLNSNQMSSLKIVSPFYQQQYMVQPTMTIPIIQLQQYQRAKQTLQDKFETSSEESNGSNKTESTCISNGNTSNKKQIDKTRFKTKMCKNWRKYQKCNYGDNCQFAHGVKELRIALEAEANSASQIINQQSCDEDLLHFQDNITEGIKNKKDEIHADFLQALQNLQPFSEFLDEIKQNKLKKQL
eukprot:TRINITY_DN1890_c0_g1_i3.p2 TRINITY_DN1890_c0_g1~~TRINITY_DN1890_c0_g1_i3.p2  ORF type:complete len:205 (+),score=63.86 TRINITY_DN1890_c0_g1_i3:64-678(+)